MASIDCLVANRFRHLFYLWQKSQRAETKESSARGYGVAIAQSASPPVKQIEAGDLNQVVEVVVIEVPVAAESTALHDEADNRDQRSRNDPFHGSFFSLNVSCVNSSDHQSGAKTYGVYDAAPYEPEREGVEMLSESVVNSS